MKKSILLLGILFIAAAVICFCIMFLYDHMGGAVMDASGDFYANAYRKYLLFRNCGIGCVIPGGVLLIIYFIVSRK